MKKMKLKVRGQEYEFSFTRALYGGLKKALLRLRTSAIREVNTAISEAEAAGAPLTDETKVLLAAAAVREACRGTVSQNEMSDFMRTPEGIAVLLQIVVGENSFTEDEAWEAIAELQEEANKPPVKSNEARPPESSLPSQELLLSE